MKVIIYKEAKNAKLADIKYEFRVIGILTEADFKALAKIALLFKVEKGGYTGLIKDSDTGAFLVLVEKVNKVHWPHANKHRRRRSTPTSHPYPW